MESTEQFQRFAITLALFQANRLCVTETEVVLRRLWAAAVYDWFMQSGELVPMLNAFDLPVADARAYDTVIQAALTQCVQATAHS